MPTYDARNIYVGDGVTTEFAVNFTLGYLSRTHVTCHVEGEVDGGGNPSYRTFTWLTDGLIEVIPAPGDTLDVTVQRTTPDDVLYHDYQDGAIVVEQNLDESNLQNIMLHHESSDDIVAHLADTDNPHEVDADDVGLGNVNNSSLTNGYWVLAGSELTTKYTLDLIIQGSLFFNDTNTHVSEDESGNLTLTDEITGTKTLAELAAGTGGSSIGINDEATGERLLLTDTALTLGTAGASYEINHVAADQRLAISGGTTSLLGSCINMYGEGHSIIPGHLWMRSNGEKFLDWNETAGTLSFYTANGEKTQALILNADQSATFAGTINLNDTNTRFFEDGSGNLSFRDAITGTKTLAELALGTGGVEYNYQEKEVGGTYIYWGFDATGTGYRIVRQTVSTGAWGEAIGTYPTPYANYAAAWTDRAALGYT